MTVSRAPASQATSSRNAGRHHLGISGRLRRNLQEWPGIFNWALQGCLEWQKIGLAPPKVVSEASEAYFAEEDLITTWIGEGCAVDEIYSASSGELYQSWKKWAEDAGEHPGSNKAFSNSLEERGSNASTRATAACFTASP
jgi:putative DNA primase/helicase